MCSNWGGKHRSKIVRVHRIQLWRKPWYCRNYQLEVLQHLHQNSWAHCGNSAFTCCRKACSRSWMGVALEWLQKKGALNAARKSASRFEFISSIPWSRCYTLHNEILTPCHSAQPVAGWRKSWKIPRWQLTSKPLIWMSTKESTFLCFFEDVSGGIVCFFKCPLIHPFFSDRVKLFRKPKVLYFCFFYC